METTNTLPSTPATWREQDALAAVSLTGAAAEAAVPAGTCAQIRVSDWLHVRLLTQAGLPAFPAEARLFHHAEAVVRLVPVPSRVRADW